MIVIGRKLKENGSFSLGKGVFIGILLSLQNIGYTQDQVLAWNKETEEDSNIYRFFESPRIPLFGLKTNVLSALYTTFNLSGEVRIAPKYTIELSLSYNPWTFSDNRKLKHIMVRPEYRYWLTRPFREHYFGAYLHYSRFNISDFDYPFGPYPSEPDERLQGDLYGGGISYGYQWMFSSFFSIEFSVGLGYSYATYHSYECGECGDRMEKGSKHYVGPDKVGISLLYIIK